MKTHKANIPSTLELSERRQMMLQKMRVKLAMHVEKEQVAEEIPRTPEQQQNRKITWVSAILLSAIFAICWVGNSAAPMLQMKKSSKIEVLKAPAGKMDLNRQLLYWTYALYDTDRLRHEFVLPKMVIVDGKIAKAQIQKLMPFADTKTQWIVQTYQQNLVLPR